MAVSVYQQGGYGTAPLFPNPIVAPRDPTTNDKVSPSGQPYQIMQGWNNNLTDTSFIYLGGGNWVTLSSIAGSVDQLTGNSGGAVVPTAGNINILGNGQATFVGSGSTLTLTQTTKGYPITPYVVGPVGQAGYQTIQSALTAAALAGGGSVYVQPGTYTENLVFPAGVNSEIVGVLAVQDIGSVTIVGVHTPPATGNVAIANCRMTSATHIFSTAVAGNGIISLLDMGLGVTNGYIFNCLNWTGQFRIDNAGSLSTTDGVVNNTGGASCFFFSTTLGNGSGNAMITSGPVIMEEVVLRCPWSAATGTTILCDYVIFTATVTCANNSTGEFTNCSFVTGATPALTMSSTAAVSLANSVITSSNNPAISGAGAGTLTLGELSFLSNSTVAGTLTIAYAPALTGASSIGGNLTFLNAGNKINSTSVATTTAAGANAFGSVTLVGGTATISTTAVTTNSLIVLWRQTVGATGAAATGNLCHGAIVNGTSFVIDSVSAADATALAATDVSVVGWMIIN